MSRLIEEGYSVSLGVLNAGDSDYVAAKTLGLDVVEEKPFSRITQGSHQRNLRFIKEADYVILTNIPIGFGNIKNLEAAAQGENLIVVEKEPIEERDHTRGEAAKLYHQLRAKASIVGDWHAVLERLKSVESRARS